MLFKKSVGKNFTENTSKETPTQEFSCELYKIFKNTTFYRTPLVAASKSY